jgi:hypothetical protein
MTVATGRRAPLNTQAPLTLSGIPPGTGISQALPCWKTFAPECGKMPWSSRGRKRRLEALRSAVAHPSSWFQLAKMRTNSKPLI